jgi:hypothetical protein
MRIPSFLPPVFSSGLRLLPAAALALACVLSPSKAPAETDASAPVTLAEYRTRLESLDRLVIACQNSVGPANCKGDQVGQDFWVVLPGAASKDRPRAVHFTWLRDLLDQAAKPEAKNPASDAKDAAPKDQNKSEAKPNPGAKNAPANGDRLFVSTDPSDVVPPTLPERLQLARVRLREDWERAGQLSLPGHGPDQAGANPGGQAAASSADHKALDAILAAKEFKLAVARRSLRDRFLEKLNGWVQWIFSKLGEVGAKSKWIGRVAEITFITVLCVVLVWLLVRLERRGRILSTSFQPGPGMAAASARDWQLWLKDAQDAAARGDWRDAIHLTYWASISRLESRGLWPADRARTPREYLALLGAADSQRPDLKALTRSFERTWYAGRDAAEADFERASQLAARLGAR